MRLKIFKKSIIILKKINNIKKHSCAFFNEITTTYLNIGFCLFKKEKVVIIGNSRVRK